MSRIMDMARELRMDPDVHYNCAQSVVLPFAKEKGINTDDVFALGKALNAGLRTGATCGAIVGGLMVLGLYGKDDPASVSEYYKRMKEKHDGMTLCADLLRVNKEKGGEKKPHCDNMVYESVEVMEEMLQI